MPLFLNPFTLPAAYLLAASVTCAPQPPAALEMEFNKSPAVQDDTKTSAELGGFKIDTVFSHGPNEIFTVGGLTVGRVGPEFKISFKRLSYPQTGENCFWPEKIMLNVRYEPKIYIAKEAVGNACKYRETLLHEARHVNTDVITIQEYLPHIHAAVTRAAAEIPVMGPLPEEALTAAQDAVAEKIKTALSGVMAQLDATRQQRQQLIDTRQEYLRLSKVCK